MAGFIVDEMGNCWDADDDDRTNPVMGHPELEGTDAECPNCGAFKWRKKTGGEAIGQERFEWRCSCGEVFEDFHH